MLRVNVHLAGLPRRAVQSPLTLELSPEATVQDLLDVLQRRHPELRALWDAQKAHRRIAVNNRQVTDPRQHLATKDGGTLEVDVLIVPPIAGGGSSADARSRGA